MVDKNKQELKNYLNNIKAVFLLGYPLKSQLADPQFQSNLETFSMTFDNEKIDYHFSDSLNSPTTRKMLINGVEAAFLKTFIVDSIGALESYCGRTNQREKLNKQPWINFFRMVRNAFAHDNHWNITDKRYLAMLPLTYYGKTITEVMNYNEIAFDFFNAHIAWHLSKDVETFVDNELT